MAESAASLRLTAIPSCLSKVGGAVVDRYKTCEVSPDAFSSLFPRGAASAGLVSLSTSLHKVFAYIISDNTMQADGSGISACIRLPPSVALQLGISWHHFPSALALQISSIPTPPSPIKELSILCIRKHFLDFELDRGLELEGFAAFFSIPRLITAGDTICIPFTRTLHTAIQSRTNRSVNSTQQAQIPPCSHMLPSPVTQWYIVLSCSHFHDSPSNGAAITHPNQTNVVLSTIPGDDRRMNALLPNLTATLAIAASELSLPPHTAVPSINNLYQSHCNNLLPHLAADFPCLVQSASVYDVKAVMTECAGCLGRKLLLVHARYLTSSHSSNSGSKPTPPSTWIHTATPAQSNAEFIDSQRPCLVLLMGVDSCLEELSASRLHSQGEDPSSMLSAKIARLLNSLKYSQSGAMVVAHTANVSALNGVMRALFPSDCVLEKVNGSEVIRQVVAFSEGGVTENVEEMNRSLDAVGKMLQKKVKAAGGSLEAVQVLLREASLSWMQRTNGTQWLSSLARNIMNDFPLLDVATAEGNDQEAPWLTRSDAKIAAQTFSENVKKLSSNASISPVQWADIGGLDRVRKEILDILQLPLLRPDLFPPGCPMRRAVLLYGPPGTGKTLVARAVATECDMAFISVKGPELLDMYVGESERNVRQVFFSARECAPCIVFFDELDSLAPARGRGSDAGGVMDRVVSQLLTEMDCLAVSSSATGVFVMGATNRPDLLDTALLRPGRFDRKVYLSVCKEISARYQILAAQTRKLTLHDGVDLMKLAECMPARVTGADIGAVTNTAFALARSRRLQELKTEAEELINQQRDDSLMPGSEVDIYQIAAYVKDLPRERLGISVTMEDFLQAVSTVKLSISDEEALKYERLQRDFDNTSSA